MKVHLDHKDKKSKRSHKTSVVDPDPGSAITIPDPQHCTKQ